ncbi:TcaA NTF2-like domain-containing protein [Halalkalibacter oceani]|uniref:TcaA protein NTF2-like domain-containing protein n=1 Tax=Halalkalibacter oceani TaxID=1653776 RepID=A0A9X2DN84_9BACI|nr:hypothetical protein [Halalkalibacter oceani]MCM3713070.1 hypothetical protein [Halalkalibacter oceani]
MKKFIVLSLFMFLSIICTACFSTEPEQLIEADDELTAEVAAFAEAYKKSMVDAVNTGDFNQMEPFLITNNSYYHSLRRYVEELHSEQVTKTLENFRIDKVYVDEIDEIHADVYEKVIIHRTEDETIERNVRYEMVRGGDDGLRIVTIRERR